MCRFADVEDRDFQRVAGTIKRFHGSIRTENISRVAWFSGTAFSLLQVKLKHATLLTFFLEGRISGQHTFRPVPNPSPPSHLDVELMPKWGRRSDSSSNNAHLSGRVIASPPISASETFTFRICDGWTEISKDLINRNSLDSTNEDYEDVGHAFIIKRVLTRSEVQLYVEKSVARAPKGIMPTYGRNVSQYFGVPLRSNPCFTGRQNHLSSLDEILYPLSKSVASHLRCAVLVGLGGCGKTEIAVRYAYLHRDEYMAVLWIDGTSESSLSSSFSRLGSRLAQEMESNSPGIRNDRTSSRSKPSDPARMPYNSYNNSSTNLVADIEVGITRSILAGRASYSGMISWLNSTHHHYHWLMIVDNLDAPEMVETLDNLLLGLDRGSVIITSRNSRASRLGTTVEVGELAADEATGFLLRSLQSWDQPLSTSPHQTLVENLCSLLGNLALAIDQAAAYINENKLSIEEYIELFQQQKAYLLGTSSSNRYPKTRSAGLDAKYDTVLMTWEISFRFIQRDSPASALLLQLLAFMNYEEISEDIFRAIHEQRGRWHKWSSAGEIIQENEWESSPAWMLVQELDTKTKFHEVVSKLLGFSLVKRALRSRCLSIHPVSYNPLWYDAVAEILKACPFLGFCTNGT
jgi:hypothetical protein